MMILCFKIRESFVKVHKSFILDFGKAYMKQRQLSLTGRAPQGDLSEMDRLVQLLYVAPSEDYSEVKKTNVKNATASDLDPASSCLVQQYMRRDKS